MRRGLVAAVVMEAAAREWTGSEDEETFRAYLVRRAVLRPEQVEEMAAVVAAEAPAGEAAEADAEAARTPPPSEIVKGFRILERLGRGGMGSVYRAEQIGMNRTVALKILRRPLARDEQQVERLRREARLVGSLEHPNIVRGLDVGQSGPYHYFAMEFVEGETLRDRLKRRGAMPEAEVLRILEQVCRALDHAHARGVVHRDVKPGNIILTSDGVPKLTDYGLAKGPADFSLTQSGVTIGTPQYISPEQARDPSRVDVQTDLYSLGATAYHMLTGVPPHASETLAGLLTKVLYEKPRTARQVNPRVSGEASFLVEKLMAKQKRHRYRTPRDVLRDLGSLAAGRSIVPRDWAGDFEVHELRRRFRRWVTAAAGVAVLALGSTVWIQHRADVEREQNRREAARRTLDGILGGERPRSGQAWENRLADLQEYLAAPDHARTPAEERARERAEEARRHVLAWKEAEAAKAFARKTAYQDRFLDAVRFLQERIGTLRDDPPYGEDPAIFLEKEVHHHRSEGFEAARRKVEEVRGQASRVPIRPGAADVVEGLLRSARDLLLEQYVESDAAGPVGELDRILERITRARVTIEDSFLGADHRARADELLREGRFAQLKGVLDGAADRIREDRDLQADLQQIPEPAAWDLRGRVEREIASVLARNQEAVERAVVQALEMERRNRFEEAVAVLDSIYERSAQEVREKVSGVREEVVARHEEMVRAREEKVRVLLASVLEDVGRRDFLGARRRLDALAPDLVREPPGSPLLAAVESARILLAHVEQEAFEPIRRRALEGRPFDLGLKFVTGDRIHHPRVSNVRLERNPTGDLLVFDAPGQPGLRRPLHELSLDLVFAYADLPPAGTGLEKALVRGALVIAEGEPWSREEIESAATLAYHARDGLEGRPGVAPTPGIPGIAEMVGALHRRADTLIEEKNLREKHLEQYAGELLREVREVVATNPKKALDNIELLSKPPLVGTRVFREGRELVLSLREQARRKMEDLKLNGLWPKWEITSEEGPGSEVRTRAVCDFSDRDQLGAFVPREDGGQRLFLIPLAAAGVNGDGPGDGRHLLFVAPDPAPLPDGSRPSTFDSPLTLECPFKPGRPISLSCTVAFRRPSHPYFLQFSIVGNHVGIATDDGRRESGRGVFVYQAEDWHTPDAFLPDVYRHGYVQETYVDRGIDPLTVTEPILGQEGIRYFQLEPDRVYAFRVELDRSHLKLFVDGNLVWDAALRNKRMRDDPPRIRIATFTPCIVDDLVVEGFIDLPHLNRLLRRK